MTDEMVKNEYVQGFLERAKKAQKEVEHFSQEEIDEFVKIIAKTVYDNAEYLAQMAVEETGMGNLPDKIAKNKGKAGIIWNSLKGKKSTGIINRDEETGIVEVAKPMGVVAAITPTTNPIVTVMSNAMFAVKGKNAIIVLPHPNAMKCCSKTVEMVNENLRKIGAPENLIQIIGEDPREHTTALISSVDVLVATGGTGMVKAAYSSGKPALGVGPGNVQVIIDRDADIKDAVTKIILGRTFDNGIICSGEQSVMIPRDMSQEVLDEFSAQGTYVVRDAKEKAAFRNLIFKNGAMNKDVVGLPVAELAKLAGVDMPEGKRMILIEADGPGAGDLLGKEKMCPVMAFYLYDDFTQAVEFAQANLDVEGKGHSAAIHSFNKEHIEYAGEKITVSRLVVNQPCSTTAGGSYFNGLAPTNTLGCGSWGNNSISENLTYKHLINISRIAYLRPDNPVPTPEELFG